MKNTQNGSRLRIATTQAQSISTHSSHSQGHNGNGKDPPQGKGGCYPASSKLTAIADEAIADTSEAQAQTRNGSNGQHDRYGKGEFFVGPKQALQDVQDKRIGPVAFVILCDVLSKGHNWQLCIKEVRKRFGWGETATRTAMRELSKAGWVTRKEERGKGGVILGRHYVVHRRPFTKTAVAQGLVDRSLREDGLEERTKEGVTQSLGRKADLKSKASAGAHGAFSLSALSEGKAEIVQRFNKTFVPKGAQPLNKCTPKLRLILRHCGWGDYTAFEKAALADQTNWRRRVKTRRPGFVALWHAYKSSPKRERRGKYDCYRKRTIVSLKEIADRLLEQINGLYHEDRKGSKRQRVKLQERLDAITAEIARKTKTTPDVVRQLRAARRSEREHQATKTEVQIG